MYKTKSPKSKIFDKIKQYLKNDKLKNLLLDGPPGANSYTINHENSQLWIDSQTSINREVAAMAIIETVRYIPHLEFINKMNQLIDKIHTEKSKNNHTQKYILVSEEENKSGFFCTMIYLFLLQNRIDNGEKLSLPYDIVGEHGASAGFSNSLKKYGSEGMNYIFINDMDYSGNQISTILRGAPRHSEKWLKKFDLNKDKSKNKIIISRVFTTDAAKEKMDKISQNSLIDIKYVFVEKIVSFKNNLINLYGNDLGEHAYNLCMMFFGDCDSSGDGVKSNVYLDHKVADYPSSISLSLSMGIIPFKSSYTKYYPGEQCNPEYNYKQRNFLTNNSTLEKEEIEHKNNIIPIINNCSYEGIEKKYKKEKGYGEMMLFMNDEDVGHYTRCPYSWYKILDYSTGTLVYPEVSLRPLDFKNKKGGKKKIKKTRRKRQMKRQKKIQKNRKNSKNRKKTKKRKNSKNRKNSKRHFKKLRKTKKNINIIK